MSKKTVAEIRGTEARKITCRIDTDSAAVVRVQPWTSQKTRVAETLAVIVTGTKR